MVGVGVMLWRGNNFLGLVIALALIGNMLVAAIAGTIIPLGLNALGQDPALGIISASNSDYRQLWILHFFRSG